MSNRCAGFIELTFMDEPNNEFVCLGGAGWRTKRELREQWGRIPACVSPTPFIADLLDASGDSIVDDRPVSSKTCERLLGKPIDVLINEGRKELRSAEQKQRERSLGKNGILKGKEPRGAVPLITATQCWKSQETQGDCQEGGGG